MSAFEVGKDFGVIESAVTVGSNVAVTFRAWSIATVQAPVPVQSPAHPAKTTPAAGAAVSATEVPSSKLAKQVAPQSMPTGAEMTCPLPVPL